MTNNIGARSGHNTINSSLLIEVGLSITLVKAIPIAKYIAIAPIIMPTIIQVMLLTARSL
jgi:hypothetical protein